VPGPGVGDLAPPFSLPGTGGRQYSLEEYRGTPVVLVFYPGDNTPVCTNQLNSYTHDFAQFEKVGAQVLAVSPQDVASHEAFSSAQGGFAFPLLADVDKEVGEAYGVLGPIGFYRRSTFVVDGEGTIRYAHRAVAGLTFRPAAELIEVVAGLGVHEDAADEGGGAAGPPPA
jgi:peroxiredoxin Q/BCP